MTPPIYSRAQAKAYAHALRSERAARNETISHAAALELVAHQLGYSNWNTLSAHLSNYPQRPLQLGDRVEGRYLKMPITGSVIAVREMAGGACYEVLLDFDEPVDVVTSDRFSNFRKRVGATISADGVSYHKTSDGVPHLIVARAN